ncbi:DUF6401 family natural product biosynthesis protein [Planosporangium mesophilum]|nr:DUF6401 family natural product biosynthesis protein [Planosporangium mesophilum]NJC82680.1 hypothetical protein [Planosporangium mesophilum]
MLRDLMTVLGTGGLAIAALLPGLLAAVDQHAAEVRDALGDGRAAPSTVALAGYAEGFIHAAEETGWDLPEPIDWVHADWRALRLLAVCALAADGREL